MILRICPLFIVLICVGGFSGCGGAKNELGRVPVSGNVTFEEKPLDRGSIEFSPTGTGTQSGAVIENGVYTIPEERGLAPGEYTVRISSPAGEGVTEEMPGDSSEIPEERIPEEFNTNSKEKVTVEAGKDNVFNFTIPKK